MKPNNGLVMLVLPIMLAMPSYAAMPQSGLWGIDIERSGQTGRGIQIDRQDGKTIIASYYGYRSDGSSAFYMAVGKIEDGSTVTADLIEYKNGTALGGVIRIGEVEKNIGKVTFEFTTPSVGFVTLPGEIRKSFSPIVYEDKRVRLNNTFRVVSNQSLAYGSSTDEQQNYQFKISGEDIQIDMGSKFATCNFKGKLNTTGATLHTRAEGGCASGGGLTSDIKDFSDINISESGRITMKVRSINSEGQLAVTDIVDGDYSGICVLSLKDLTDFSPKEANCRF